MKCNAKLNKAEQQDIVQQQRNKRLPPAGSSLQSQVNGKSLQFNSELMCDLQVKLCCLILLNSDNYRTMIVS